MPEEMSTNEALLVLAAHARGETIDPDSLDRALARADKVGKAHGRPLSPEEAESVRARLGIPSTKPTS